MKQRKKGILYLIPTPLSENTAHQFVTKYIADIIMRVDYYLVENIRTARRFLGSLDLGIDIESIQFELVDKHTSLDQIELLLEPLTAGCSAGVLSEAGCPGIADPGALIVTMAHQKNIDVEPLIGPSSIFMALMASGFNGQSFAFHGYLPIGKASRIQSIKTIEKTVMSNSQTQMFMETPYRNNKLFEDLLQHCHPQTKLCVASDITGKNQLIKTQKIQEWKSNVPNLHKIPTIFLIGV